MNDTDRRRVYRHLRARFAFLLDEPDAVMECYGWAWVFSVGALDAKSIDKACRAHAMALGWRRRGGIGAWFRRERSMDLTLAPAAQDRVMLRLNGPCAPRVRNKRFKQTRHTPHAYRQMA